MSELSDAKNANKRLAFSLRDAEAEIVRLKRKVNTMHVQAELVQSYLEELIVLEEEE